ncbi:hypothetical protein X769_24475 [Mesorhizobium sp. LSJC268A00]|uniref:FAD-dependent oxidoreductase n=1 Tax=unclassified Mesorhizobium TaxID=325217 RepID=UPI0003CEE756|nr:MULTISPECIES: FAD-dependent oxidoreductase [unclassified Mesorhizobium]ESW99302.1 hypothetical protein X769_24475 [Mesorhizobium sp. LSJC268A00]ESZ12897.1 hypothetical protein X735_21170 [Mesorhizobium sp. L2C085B000]
MSDAKTPARILDSYRVGKTPLFLVGTYDNGVTVFSQQVRALNLIWAAVESDFVSCSPDTDEEDHNEPMKVAIIGGGIAGLATAAALMKKQANAKITIFEQRDTLLPLQHGSDSRWLHPRIYDWPGEGSSASVAMLPVLNWTAARASDVVVQILGEWKKVIDEHGADPPRLFCNARHLQVDEPKGGGNGLDIEWVAEERRPHDGTQTTGLTTAKGATENFDIVILAVGFGLEKDGALSYWRNDTIGQPSLDQPRRTYLVSGQGDGAMIDLLRIRISQYRQDRILDELFRGRDKLLLRLKELHTKHGVNRDSGLFQSLENLEKNPVYMKEFEDVCLALSGRLRRDTDAVLHLLVRKFSDLFDPMNTKISFQNRLLVYLLYKCGGFVPSSQRERSLIKQHSIPQDCIVRRHGTYREEQLEEMLSEPLYSAIKSQRTGLGAATLSQTDGILWPGGYFGIAGKLSSAGKVDDPGRAEWRKEYLPGPTALLAAAYCGALAGALRADHPGPGRLRVTLHRAVVFGPDELLQQCCEYFGTSDARGGASSAARTFPALNATIGLAYRTRRIVRSLRAVSPELLSNAMNSLDLSAASRKMASEVGFVMAIPILEPEQAGLYTAPNPVAGVVYVDSAGRDFWIDDNDVARIVSMTNEFVRGLNGDTDPFDKIRNVPLSSTGGALPEALSLPPDVANALELSIVQPPRVSGPFQFNFDYTDFITGTT